MPVFLTERGEGLALSGWKDRGSGWNPGGSQKARQQPRAWEVGRVVGLGSRGVGALGLRAFVSKELEGEGGVLSCCCMGLFVRKRKMLAGEPAVGTEWRWPGSGKGGGSSPSCLGLSASPDEKSARASASCRLTTFTVTMPLLAV